jgi:transposase-like protein
LTAPLKSKPEVCGGWQVRYNIFRKYKRQVCSHLVLLSSHNKKYQGELQTMSEKIVQFNEGAIKNELKDLVRNSVEETLNGLLDQEAEKLTQAAKYERTNRRQGYRSGSYTRKLGTTSGEVSLKVPKLKGVPFETAIIERYRRRESSVEEALIEMYLAGVSVRRVEDITEALWGSKVSPSTISELNKKAYVNIEKWRNRPLRTTQYPYVYVDGLYLKRNWGGSYENVSVLTAIGVTADGHREVLGAAEGMKEDKSSWLEFFKWLKGRGLSGVRLIVGDKCLGMVEAAMTVYPQAKYQRCIVHFYRNVFSVVPKSKSTITAKMLKAIHAQESKEASLEKSRAVIEALKEMKLKEAAKKIEDSIEETLTYTNFPFEHWLRIRTNNAIERVIREIRRRTRVVGCFPDGNSALMLVCARLRYVAGSQWGNKMYMNMKHLKVVSEVA